MNDVMQELYDLAGQPGSVAEWLDSLPYDELVEIDVANNRIKNLFHVDGKFFVPVFDGSYQDLYRYCNDHMVHPDDRHIHVELMDFTTILQRLAASETPGVLSAEFRYRLQNDEWRWVRQFVLGGPENGLAEGVIRFYVFDIENAKEHKRGKSSVANARVHHDERLDPTTGLLREKEFFANVTERLMGNDLEGWCFVAIDIDQFKLFNDWYGREAGDSVLARFGAYFCEREKDDGWLAGYLGQDDFCVLMPYGLDTLEALYADLANIIAAYGTSTTGFTPVMGVAMVAHGAAVLDLLDCAMLASQAARKDFRRRIHLFEPSLYKQTEAEYRLLDEFQKALANRELFFYLQPQCRISTGKIVGVEALARWQRPTGEFVDPNEFVPMLEKFGFVTDLDRYIWEEVCKHLKAWIDSGHDPVPVSVNVSKNDIYAIDVPKHFESLVESYAIPRSLIKIEITESAYADDEHRVGETVRELREAGFMVLMDDFGSGYSSLNMLDSVGVDVIKLDMMFLHMNEHDKRKSIHIIESVVNMAKTLDLLVITEGVETEEQANFLRSIGCRYVQGYYFYRPMSCDDFERLIEDGSQIDMQGFTRKANDEFRIREFLDSNVYSDSMLNSILGAVILLSWKGNNVDIVRYNEQFYEMVGINDIEPLLSSVQNLVDIKERGKFLSMLNRAMEDQLNGTTGIIRFRKPDGSPLVLLLHFYYLGSEGGSHKFYASARDVTALTALRIEMKQLSEVAHMSIAFVKKYRETWLYNVEVHGIEDELGLSRREFENELRSGAFMGRLDKDEAEKLRNAGLSEAGVDDRTPRTFKMTNARGEKISLGMTQFRVESVDADFSSIIIFQGITDKSALNMPMR